MANKRLSSLRSSKEPASSKKTKRTDPTDGVTALTVEAPDDGSSSPPPSYEEPERHTGEIEEEEECRFYGKPVPEEEARRRWPHRYQNKSKRKENDGSKNSTVDDLQDLIQAMQHYTKAKEGRITYNLGDDAHVKAGDGEENYICKIVEMFRATDGLSYFRAQWYYRAKDTVIKSSSDLIDNKRVFYSEIKDDNPLDCLVRKLNIVRLPLDMKSSKEAATSECDYYCDMMYLLPYSSFMKLPLEDSCSTDNMGAGSETDSTISSDSDVAGARSHTKFDFKDVPQGEVNKKTKLTLLDLYAGCGGMSTGLCLGANTSGVSLVTKWAVDLNPYACESLRHNHPETQVRNESAEDFLSLLKEWKGLYASFTENEVLQQPDSSIVEEDDGCDNANDGDEEEVGEVFEVEKILGICYGDPKENKKPGLYFKIRWKGYGPEEDTWEPLDGLGNCQDRIKEFVISGYRSKILPLPGDIDVVCGGPPCQGISGFNRFREAENPFKDEKNKQLLVYMDIIDYLKPRFVLMENVVDLLKFAGGFLGRYALGRLVGMNYQARLGMMAAGAYGLPQFRMRVFVWGALPSEKLPQYPLPIHDVVTRGVIPTEFELNTVSYGEGREVELEKALLLEDAISDLPPVENNEGRDEMKYDEEPKTEFQKFIRLQKDELLSNSASPSTDLEHILFDHRPLQLNDDDYQRVCQIPKRKGANFRHLKGVRVRDDKKVEWDPDVERVYLPSGKPLVPDYAMTFVGGTSSKPFGRLWWDETVPTVVTRAEPHNQVILHPLQDRVLTIRENARLQGFPDYYKLFGPIKERYIQVGNAVAVPVSRALGYALGLAVQGIWSEEPLVTLPRKFPYISESSSQELEEVI